MDKNKLIITCFSLSIGILSCSLWILPIIGAIVSLIGLIIGCIGLIKKESLIGTIIAIIICCLGLVMSSIINFNANKPMIRLVLYFCLLIMIFILLIGLVFINKGRINKNFLYQIGITMSVNGLINLILIVFLLIPFLGLLNAI